MAMFISSIALFTVGVVHFVPIAGVRSSRLRALYGVDVEHDEVTRLLLRHRAVLFGVLGALLMAAAFVPSLRLTAIAAGLVSTLSFVILARGVPSAPVQRILRVDVACATALAIAAFL